MSNVSEPVFADESVAEQLTVVTPNGNVEPDAGTHVGVIAPSTSSTADALKTTVAPDPLVASSIISEGTVTTGAVVSGAATTLTSRVTVDAGLPAESFTSYT